MKNILTLSPVFKEYIWGGNKLKTTFNKNSKLDKIAESWELACHPNGTNTIYGSNISLSEYISSHPDILGDNCKSFNTFPILIKLIDAKDNLSVQVHPDDSYAIKFENSFGKTEMWYVIDCEPDSYLYYGFNKELDYKEFKQRIQDNTLPDILNKVPIKKGDTFFIEAGTIHAICKNTLIAEIQQNSDITYRIYDYERTDKNNKPRELHINKALEVTSLKIPEKYSSVVIEATNEYKKTLLAKCKYFEVYKYDIKTFCDLHADSSSFHSILCISGSAVINIADNMCVNKGDSIFVPANTGTYRITGSCEILLTLIPDNTK